MSVYVCVCVCVCVCMCVRMFACVGVFALECVHIQRHVCLCSWEQTWHRGQPFIPAMTLTRAPFFPALVNRAERRSFHDDESGWCMSFSLVLSLSFSLLFSLSLSLILSLSLVLSV